jgi:hypothetical protein
MGNASGAEDIGIPANELWFTNKTVSGFNLAAFSSVAPDVVGRALRRAVQAVATATCAWRSKRWDWTRPWPPTAGSNPARRRASWCSGRGDGRSLEPTSHRVAGGPLPVSLKSAHDSVFNGVRAFRTLPAPTVLNEMPSPWAVRGSWPTAVPIRSAVRPGPCPCSSPMSLMSAKGPARRRAARPRLTFQGAAAQSQDLADHGRRTGDRPGPAARSPPRQSGHRDLFPRRPGGRAAAAGRSRAPLAHRGPTTANAVTECGRQRAGGAGCPPSPRWGHPTAGPGSSGNIAPTPERGWGSAPVLPQQEHKIAPHNDHRRSADATISPPKPAETPLTWEGFRAVELRGLEPLTPSLPVRCATSCAIAPRRR